MQHRTANSHGAGPALVSLKCVMRRHNKLLKPIDKLSNKIGTSLKLPINFFGHHPVGYWISDRWTLGEEINKYSQPYLSPPPCRPSPPRPPPLEAMMNPQMMAMMQQMAGQMLQGPPAPRVQINAGKMTVRPSQPPRPL